MNQIFRSEILQYLKQECEKHSITIEPGKIRRYHCDVFLPELNCGILIHSIDQSNINQTIPLADQNHRGEYPEKVIHVWEDQWIFYKQKVMSKIKSLLGITTRVHGRETKVKPLDNKQLIQFLMINHLHVPIKAKYKFGLVKENELLAVMSFSGGRKIVREGITYNSFELLRFCNKLNTTVVGGFSKLLNHFIKTHNPDDVMTYVDADWSDGDYFIVMGFELMGKQAPMEFWLNTGTGIREYPHLVLKRLNLPVNTISSEEEKSAFLKSHGYLQVYNSGSYKYLLKRK